MSNKCQQTNKHKLKQLHETIDTILKARKIQKAKVDENLMREELKKN